MPDIYEIVNATQLNSDLEDVADAIRAKSQGQDPLLFPSEFISEIGSIPTGASITGQTDVTVKALENIAEGDTLFIYKPMQAMFVDKLAGDCHKVAWKPDGTRLAITHGSSPRISIYDTSTWPYTKISDPDTLPTGTAWGCSWSPDGTRLAVAHDTSPYITIYDTTTTPYTKITNPGTLPVSTSYGCSWSPDGTRLAVAHKTSPYITIYDTTTTPYTKITNPGTLPAGNANGCSWSPDGKKLAVAHDSSPYMTVYNTETTPYTKLTNPTSLPNGNANECAWSADGERLAIGHGSSRYLSIYNTATTPYTRLTTGAMTANVHQMAFYGSGHQYIAVTLYGGSEAGVYDIDNNLISYFKFGPFYYGYGCAFSPDFKKIAIASYGATGYKAVMNVFVYEYSETEAEKASNVARYSMGGSYGYAKSSIAAGSTGAAAILFEP